MQKQMHRASYGIALILLATGLGSCQLFGNEKASDATASIPAVVPATPVEANESPEVEVEVKNPPKQVIAATPLTRSTDPDARVKVIKKGRPDPFAQLLPSRPKSSALASSRPAPNPSTARLSTPSALKSNPSSKGSDLPRLTTPVGKTDPSAIVLPPLPEPTLAKQVTVQGVMVIGGQPKAILSAPEEGISRTVGVGDYLSNGQILVSAIDVSNQQEPVVILQESGRTVSVGVGKAPVVAGAPSSSESLSAKS